MMISFISHVVFLFFLVVPFHCSVTVNDDAKSVFENFKLLLNDMVGNDAVEAVTRLREESFTQIIHLTDAMSARNHREDSDPTPVVQMHGMGDFANDPFGMVPLAEAISDYLGGAYVLNVQIGDTNLEDIMNGFIMNLDDQVDYFANVIQNDTHLTNGFNAIGYSQGNLVIRGYIERYNNPPIMNFISMHGPLAGVGGFPGCSIDTLLCRAFAELLGKFAYLPFIQEHLTQSNYYRDPLKIPDYLNGNHYLVDINNENSTQENIQYNENYKLNWCTLNSICLVKALKDTIVIPNESEWFGYFNDGNFNEILKFNETSWYINDLYGLYTLNTMEHVYFNITNENHLDFSTDYLLDLVGIYFT